jgi:hypothetical protein
MAHTTTTATTETFCRYECGNDFSYAPYNRLSSDIYDDFMVTPTGIEPVFQP